MSLSKKRVFNDINITPFVDVMLVLLIIFMAVTPMIHSSIDVTLPEADIIVSDDIQKNVNAVFITIKKDGTIFLDEKAVACKEVEFELLKKYSKDINLLLKADKEVIYSDIINLMSTLQNSGFHKISLAIDPNEIQNKK
ncbi:biopolymer transporter ExbD [Anaplasmataceae bacterium AB001_6]|nr:biopolymer transporter ExbD [Anaplasmataceae bacterium AB001_6]